MFSHAIIPTAGEKRSSPRDLWRTNRKKCSRQCVSSLENDRFSSLEMINAVRTGAEFRTRSQLRYPEIGRKGRQIEIVHQQFKVES
jgi:hypothetical protein